MEHRLFVPMSQAVNDISDLIEYVSLVVHEDQRLSPAAKFGLSVEFQGIIRLLEYIDDWQENDTQRLIAHLKNIHRLSTFSTKVLLQGFSQFPSLLPKELDLNILIKANETLEIAI